MYKPYFIIIFLFIGEFVLSQDTCNTAIPFCDDSNFQNIVGNNGNAETGPDYGCLITQPNPIWGLLKIQTDGDLDLEMSLIDANGDEIDIDFISYGPFIDTTTLCQMDQLTSANTVGCGYTASTTEELTISSTLANEYYLILITRFSAEAGTLTFKQTNIGDLGAGELACDVVCDEIPEFTVTEDQYTCPGSSIPLVKTFRIESSEDSYTYSWVDENDVEQSNTDTFDTSVVGDYTVTATSTTNPECKSSKIVRLIASSPAVITNLIIDENWAERNSTVEVEITGIGIFQYALDDIDGPYQDEPYFTNIPPGIHEVFVKDTNDCDTTSKEFNLFGYYPFFTPNGDGFHDTWKIEGITSNATSKVYIFDRFGKLIAQFYPSLNEGWDGLYRNKPAPETDYWFSAEMVNYKGETIIKKGHFSLIRKYN